MRRYGMAYAPPDLDDTTLTSAPAGMWLPLARSAAYYNGVTYFGYIRGDNGNCELRTYTHATGTVSAATVLRAALDVDDHCAPSVIVRASDHKIMAWYSSHSGSQLYQWTSASAESIASGSEVNLDAQLTGTAYTYPHAFELTSGIHLFYRPVARIAGQHWGYSVSTDNGTTWPASTTFYDIASRFGYPMAQQTGPDRIDVIAIDGSQADDTDQSIHHFYLSGGTWRAADGSALTLPVTEADAPVVWDGTTETHDAYQREDAILGADGHPRIIFSTSSGSDRRYRLARWDGSEWVITTIAPGRPADPAGACFEQGDPNVVYLVTAAEEIARYVTSDDGATWAMAAVTSGSGSNHFYPISPRNATGLLALWPIGSWSDFENFSTGTSGYVG